MKFKPRNIFLVASATCGVVLIFHIVIVIWTLMSGGYPAHETIVGMKNTKDVIHRLPYFSTSSAIIAAFGIANFYSYKKWNFNFTKIQELLYLAARYDSFSSNIIPSRETRDYFFQKILSFYRLFFPLSFACSSVVVSVLVVAPDVHVIYYAYSGR